MNYYDQACRYLVKVRPTEGEMVSWLTSTPNLQFDGWLDARQTVWPKNPDRTSDTVAHVSDQQAGGVPFLIVIEFQIQPDARMTARLLSYMGNLLGDHQPTAHAGDEYGVLGVVVNLRGKGRSSRQMRLSSGPEFLHTSLGVAEWNMQEQEAVEIVEAVAEEKAPATLLAWVPLMHGGQDGTILPRWREVADAQPRREVREALSLVLLFAEATGCQDVWNAGLRGWNVTVPQFIQGYIELGRAEGKAEGRAEGEVKEKQEGIRRILRRRLGSVPADVESRLTQADAATLDRYFDAALTGSLEEFRAQL